MLSVTDESFVPLVSFQLSFVLLVTVELTSFHCYRVLYLCVCLKAAYAENVHIVLSCPNQKASIPNRVFVLI